MSKPGELSGTFAAALVAGGRSRRMGTDKAFIPWNGRPLWRHQYETLKSLRPGSLLLSCRPEQPFSLPPDVTPVFDDPPDCGPLGGIAACLQICQAPLLVVLGVDLPQLPVAFLSSLLTECRNNCGAVVRLEKDGPFEPLAAVYSGEMLTLAREHLAAGRLSMQDFITCGIERGLMSVSGQPVRAEWFRNLNAPDELN